MIALLQKSLSVMTPALKSPCGVCWVACWCWVVDLFPLMMREKKDYYVFLFKISCIEHAKEISVLGGVDVKFKCRGLVRAK